MIAALVPVKRLEAAKSRLLPALARADVERLTLAMLEDVVSTLREVRGLDPVVVVTEDEAAARAARAAGARALLCQDPGLNAALDAAAAQLAAEGAHGTLVLLGDVAGAKSGDVAALLDALAALGGRGVVLAPSRDGGSAALLRAPHDVIASAFGEASAASHRALARAAGVPFRELRRPSLEIDLDRAEDVGPFLRGPGGGKRTRQLLHELGLGAPC